MSKETASKDQNSKQKSTRQSTPAPEAAAQTGASFEMQGALADPQSASSAQILQLQRRYGNRAVQRLIQRSQADIQRNAPVGLEGGEVGGDLQGQINSARGGGQPLDEGVSARVGGALGADFSNVKVHTDAHADSLNRSLSARAFTLGNDVFFSQGAYQPGTESGKHLLAHELTHVVQQGASKTNKVQTKLKVGPAGDKYEQEADAVANRVMQVGTASSTTKFKDEGDIQTKRLIQRHGLHEEELHRKPLKAENSNKNGGVIQRAPVQSYGGTFTDVRYEGAQGHGQVGAVIDLSFMPNDLIQSPKIGLTQTVKATKDGVVNAGEGREDLEQRMQGRKDKDEGRFLDRGAPKDLRKDKHFYQENPIFGMENQPSSDGRTLGGATSRTIKANRLGGEGVDHPDVQAGTYGSRDDRGNVVPATLHDEPGRPVGGDLDMSFESAAVVLDGPQKGTYLGSVEWGFKASGNGAPTLYPFKLISKGTPTKAFMKSVKLWNKQTDLEMLTQETKVVGKPSILAGEKRSFLKLFETKHETKTLDLTGANYKNKVAALDKRIKQLEKELAKRNQLTPEDAANKDLELQGLKRQREETYRGITSGDAQAEFQKLKSGWFTSKAKRRARAIEMLNQSPSKAVEIQTAYDTVFAPEKFKDLATSHFEELFKGFGANVDEYGKLLNKFPTPFKAFIDDGAKKAMAQPQFETMTKEYARRVRRGEGLSPQIIAIAQQHVGDRTGLMNDFMNILKHGDEADVTEVEKDYNEVIPHETGLDAPPTLGELASEYFVRHFKDKGGAVAVYKQLSDDFKPLRYRIKPAYRLTFGEDELQKVLKQLKEDDLKAAVPDPDGLDNQLDKVSFMIGGPYTVENFTSSTSLGMFDAAYDPFTEELKITVKLAFEFRDLNLQGQSVVTAPTKALDPTFLKNTWDDTAKGPWLQNFKDQIDAVWNGKFNLKCVRPGWEDITAKPVFEVKEVPMGQQHFKVNVDKAALVDDSGTEKMKTEGGSSFADIKTRVAQLREFDLVDKISDPAVHHYLHEGEKSGSIKPAYELDRRRLETTLGKFGKLACQPNSQSLQDDMDFTRLSDALKLLGVPSDLSHLHPIEITGSVATGENGDLAARRASYLKLVLTHAGIQNTITTKTSADNFAGVSVKAGPVDPTVMQNYVTNWSRISAAHEYGHMIGLADEYNPAASIETVKKLISDGMLPPETPTDHLSSQGKGKEGAQGAKQAAYMKMLEELNMYSPGDFAPDKLTPMSTSLMTGGYKLKAQHFIPIWEVLGQITAPAGLGRKFWEIQ